MAGAFPSVPGHANPGRDTPGVPGPLLPSPPAAAITLNPSPSIPIPIAGFPYEQADIIELWSNPAAFFQQRVIFRATQTTTGTTLPHGGTIETIIYDNIIEDPYAGWQANVNGQWTAPFAGWYQMTITVWVTTSAANTALQVYAQSGKAPGNLLQGVPISSTPMPNGNGGSETTWYVYLAAGDTAYAAAAIRNASADVTTDLTSGQQSSMEIVWISS